MVPLSVVWAQEGETSSHASARQAICHAFTMSAMRASAVTARTCQRRGFALLHTPTDPSVRTLYCITTSPPILDSFNRCARSKPPACRLKSVARCCPDGLHARHLGLIGLPAAQQPVHGHCVRPLTDRKSTRLNSSHLVISYAVF